MLIVIKKYKWHVVVNGVVTFWLISTSDYNTISHHTNNAYNHEQDFEGICIREKLEKRNNVFFIFFLNYYFYLKLLLLLLSLPSLWFFSQSLVLLAFFANIMTSSFVIGSNPIGIMVQL